MTLEKYEKWWLLGIGVTVVTWMMGFPLGAIYGILVMISMILLGVIKAILK